MLTGRITSIVTNVEWHNYFNNPTPTREMMKSVETQRINMMNKRRHLTPNAHKHMSPTYAQINIQKVNQVANGHKANRTMYWMSESVVTIVGELRECSEKCLVMLGGKNSRKLTDIGWVIVLSNKIRLLDLESY